MASRTRNRALGIAALLFAAAAAVVIVLLSGNGNPPVTPLREETTNPRPRSERSHDSSPGTAWAETGERSRSNRGTARRRSRDARKPKQRAGRRERRTAQGRGGKHELRPRPAGSKPRPRGRPLPPPPVSPFAPAPVSLPAPPQGDAAPADATPKRPADVGTRPVGGPVPPAPKSTIFEVEVSDSKLDRKHDEVHSSDGHFRLQLRSDELVIVEVEGHPFSELVLPGVKLIEFDSPSARTYELELRRHKGLLALVLERD